MTHYPKGGDASGQDGRTLYLNAVDEALTKRRGPGAPRGPRRPRRQVNDVAVRQLRDVEKQRRILSRRLAPTTDPCVSCHLPKDLEPAELRALVEASASVSHQIVQLSQSIRLGYKQENEAFKGLTEEQLEAVFRAQLPRIASGMTDRERRSILEIWFGPDVADVLLNARKVA